MTQAVTPPVVQLCKPRVSTWVVRRGTGADDEASSVVRDLHGVPERAGLSAELWCAWSRAEATDIEAGRGSGHPQVERLGGGFWRRASDVPASPACERTDVGVGREVPARGAPRGGGGSGKRGREGHRRVGGARGVLDEGREVCPQLSYTFRRPVAESEEGPLPFTECAAAEVGREEAAVLGGPEARPQLPTFPNAGVVEEKFRDRPAERPAGPPGKLTCEDTEVKVEPCPLMGEARAVT